MDSPRTRRVRNLRKLIDDRYDGVISKFAREVDMHPTYVSNILATLRGKKGARPLTEDTAAKIEAKLGLAEGELSRDPDEDGGSRAPNETLEAILRAIEQQGEGAQEVRRALTALRDDAVANSALLQLVCVVLAERDPKLAPMLSRATRESARRVGAEEGSSAFREKADALSKLLADLPPSLEDAARLAASRSGSSNDAGRQ